MVVDLHAKFAGLCKSVEEEGQVRLDFAQSKTELYSLTALPFLQPPLSQVQNTLRQLEAQVEAAAARGAALNVG